MDLKVMTNLFVDFMDFYFSESLDLTAIGNRHKHPVRVHQGKNIAQNIQQQFQPGLWIRWKTDIKIIRIILAVVNQVCRIRIIRPVSHQESKTIPIRQGFIREIKKRFPVDPDQTNPYTGDILHQFCIGRRSREWLHVSKNVI